MCPAQVSNQITYLYFYTLGGLANPNVHKVTRRNGAYEYYTYHLVSVR